MAGFVLSTFFFLAYLALSYVQAMSEDDDSPSKAIKGKLLIPNP
jgi:preprotein translocase subunit SecG